MLRIARPPLLVFALALCACGEEVPAPETIDESFWQLPDGGVVPPAVELGYYYEREYDRFETGDDCPIFYGLQGGSWTMPAVRMRGILSPARVEMTLVTEGGETLGQIDQRHSFSSKAEAGWVEIKRLPVPAAHDGPATGETIDDLFGQTATLSATISDEEGRSASTSVEVILADRPIL